MTDRIIKKWRVKDMIRDTWAETEKYPNYGIELKDSVQRALSLHTHSDK